MAMDCICILRIIRKISNKCREYIKAEEFAANAMKYEKVMSNKFVVIYKITENNKAPEGALFSSC